MINQKESKQVSMDSWLLKLLSRDMKTRQKTKINQQTIIRNNRKVKAMGTITPTMDHYPRKIWEIGDGRYRFLILYVMLTQVMSHLLPGFRVVLESIRSNP